VLPAIGGWLVLALVFVLKTGLALTVGEGVRGFRRHFVRWMAVPIIVIATFAAVVTDVPMRAGLVLASPQLRNYAENPAAPDPQWAGLYPIHMTERLPNGGARFVISYAGFINDGGFAYSPHVTLVSSGDDYYKHVQGPWYSWVRNF
jgi:hypothetical protein